jgi:hypothetical protein
MDERHTGHVVDEGVDHVGVGDVWELIALLGAALNVLLEGLIGPQLVVVEIPGVAEPSESYGPHVLTIVFQASSSST